MTRTSSGTGELIRLLRLGPERLQSLAAGLSGSQVVHRPDPDTWSFNDILIHLRACSDVWGGSIAKMIEQDHPTMRYVSPRTVMKRKKYHDVPFQEALGIYVRQRGDLVSLLAGLETDAWSRGATFTATTRGREATVLSYARRITDHEAQHLAQIEQLLPNL